jgi:hypothetical protein
MDEWAVLMLGLYETAAGRINAVNSCLIELREAGVIR